QLAQRLLGGAALGSARCGQEWKRSRVAHVQRQRRLERDVRVRARRAHHGPRRRRQAQHHHLYGQRRDRRATRQAEQPHRVRHVRARATVRVLRPAMPLLADKKLLITGVLSQRSIAYGIAKACKREGATLAFTYVNDELKERVVKLASEFGPCPVLPCDV